MDPVVLPPQNDLHDGMAAARIAGYSWPEIHQFVASRMAQSQAAVGDGPTRMHLGLGDPTELNDRLQRTFTRNHASAKE